MHCSKTKKEILKNSWEKWKNLNALGDLWEKLMKTLSTARMRGCLCQSCKPEVGKKMFAREGGEGKDAPKSIQERLLVPTHSVGEGDVYITKNAPYALGNFHACVITRFQKPQQLSWAGRARLACSWINTCAAGPRPDLSSQRCCKLRLKLLVDQLAKKIWKLIFEFVTTKRLVSKNGHSLVEPPSRVFYTVSVSACLFLGERFFQKVYGCPLPSTSPFTLFAR